MIELRPPLHPVICNIRLGGSKSISNRLLILNKILEGTCKFQNISDSDDTQVMLQALETCRHANSATIDAGHAGTAMRFLTAYLAQKPGQWLLTGSARMKERPLGPLVEALRQAGAEIEYAEKQGYAPLHIKGKQLKGGRIAIDGSMSSQFISALLLIAPVFREGITLSIENGIVSEPYINMTIGLLREFGINVLQEKNILQIAPGQIPKVPASYSVEPDWSSASYWFSVCALSPGSEITLHNLRSNSLQADAVLPQLYGSLGLSCTFENEVLLIRQTGKATETLTHDFTNCPDIAQTVAATCFGLGIKTRLKGLKTLKIKETDRIEALATELRKLGAEINHDNNSIDIGGTLSSDGGKLILNAYGDHRMAMSFAPLALCTGNLRLADESVVSKSYPRFWNDLKSAGFSVHLLP